jgi:CarD family transcriptional regulator
VFKVGEYLVYRRDVCKLVEIKHNYFNNYDYYVLIPLLDDSLKIEVPISNKSENLRPLITKEKVNEIIKEIPNVEILNCDDNRLIENEYKMLINSGKLIDLVKIIKTTYLRNKEKIDKKKKTNDKDNNYLCLAEKYLYQEFSIVLDMSYDDTKKYVIDEVNKLCN